MDKASLAIYIHELRNQCLYTEAAFRVFNQSIQQNINAGAFFAAQSTLLCASQIAALLWPTRARVQKRGEALREVLRLPEKHPLNDRRLSALWEHGDEKLEDWIGKSKGEKIVFDHVGSLEELKNQMTIADGNIFRLYDPTTMTFYYRGDGFKMQGIADSISNIYSKVITVHRQMFPDHYVQTESSDTPKQPGLTPQAKAEEPAPQPEKEEPAKKPSAKKASPKKGNTKKIATKKKPSSKSKK